MQEFIDAARSLIGIPYHFKGRSNGGLDCGGHYIKSLNNSGLYPTYEFLDYGTNPNPKHLIKELCKVCDIVQVIEPGCVLLINYSGLPQHIAIYSEVNTLIHVYKASGTVTEEKFNNFWKSRVDTIFKVRIK